MRNLIPYIIVTSLFCVNCSGKRDSIPEVNNGSSNEVMNSPEQSLQQDTVKTTNANSSAKNGQMVYFEGGTITIGSNEGMPNEAPAFDTNIDPFYIDKHPVTVAKFREFINGTNYKTDAEKFGDAGVYNMDEQRWELVKGATWEFPLGPDKPAAKSDHPVTQVSWNDAIAYCDWAGMRLPTEFEWEYAARGGINDGRKFSWGNAIFEDGQFKSNVWQGDLSAQQGADGFVYTSPVGYYGETDEGLTDMGGNVWEWCQNTHEPYPGGHPFRVNPTVKTIKGGSFFYDQAGDLSYTVSFRGSNSVETSLFNAGFRCAKDAN